MAADSTLPKPIVFGCAGPTLTAEERAFFKAHRPLGFVAFKRNCVDKAQLAALIADFRDIVGDALAPVFIDQEGGRVERMRRPVWWEAPAAGVIGALADRDLDAALALAREVGEGIGAQLAEVGINVDFAPCLDVTFPYTHNAIGDRSFHADPAIVSALGRAYADGLGAFGVQACLKHIPGHGRARLDSHLDLPVIEADLEELAVDLAPFAALNDLPWGMISHLLFPALDPNEPATTSAKIIREIVRERIGFSGILVTDDISMKALKAPVEVSSVRALEAGCDVVVHCNGDMAEMAAIAEAIAPMGEDLWRRLAAIASPARPAAEPLAPLFAAVDTRLGRTAQA